MPRASRDLRIARIYLRTVKIAIIKAGLTRIPSPLHRFIPKSSRNFTHTRRSKKRGAKRNAPPYKPHKAGPPFCGPAEKSQTALLPSGVFAYVPPPLATQARSAPAAPTGAAVHGLRAKPLFAVVAGAFAFVAGAGVAVAAGSYFDAVQLAHAVLGMMLAAYHIAVDGLISVRKGHSVHLPCFDAFSMLRRGFGHAYSTKAAKCAILMPP